MSDKFKNSKFFAKLKNANVNRATVITTVILLVAMAVIIGVTVASNRSKKDYTETPLTDGDEVTPSQTDKVPEQTDKVETPPTTTPPSGNASTPTVDTLPSFVLPVNGSLLKGHDASLQVHSTTMADYRVHLGIDIITEENAPVYAAADGKISQIWEDVKMGYCLAIEHSGDCVTVYKNLGETLPEGIAEGVSVRAGQLIATVGNSAMIEIAEEPHLHFEMTVNGLSVDPREYYDETSLKSLGIDASYEE